MLYTKCAPPCVYWRVYKIFAYWWINKIHDFVYGCVRNVSKGSKIERLPLTPCSAVAFRAGFPCQQQVIAECDVIQQCTSRYWNCGMGCLWRHEFLGTLPSLYVKGSIWCFMRIINIVIFTNKFFLKNVFIKWSAIIYCFPITK